MLEWTNKDTDELNKLIDKISICGETGKEYKRYLELMDKWHYFDELEYYTLWKNNQPT